MGLDLLFAYSIGLIIFVIGLFFIVLSFFVSGGLASSILIGLGTALCPTGVVSIIFQYFQEKVFVDKMQDFMTKNSIIPFELGIKQIFRNREEYQQCNYLSNAKYKINYLAVCPGGENPKPLFDLFRRKMEKGVQIRVLMCNPEKPFITQWFELSSESYPSYIKENLYNCFKGLIDLKQECPNFSGNLEARVYDTNPGHYITVVDDKLFFQPYLYGSEGGEPMMLELSSGDQFDLFSEHFNKLWKNSVPIKEMKKNLDLS